MNISFIIPAYNESSVILRCIQSIIIECETYWWKDNLDYEIVVVDNNSTDDTRNVIKKFNHKRVFLIRCEEQGVTRARQMGAEYAAYDIQAYIDADNTLPTGWLDNIIELIEDDSIVCITGPVIYGEKGVTFLTFNEIFNRMAKTCHYFWPSIQGGNFILRKEALDKIGGHSTGIDFYGEDTDLAKRLSKVGKIKMLPKMWIWSSARRLNAQGTINTVSTYIMNYFSVHALGKPITKVYKNFRSEND